MRSPKMTIVSIYLMAISAFVDVASLETCCPDIANNTWRYKDFNENLSSVT
jgi:hypothetical protein